MDKPKGKALGGLARANSLTPERRREIAAGAVAERKRLASLPKSSFRGEINIGGITLACCVLEDGRRIISEGGINSTLGSVGGKTYRLRDANVGDGVGPMPIFLASKALQPYVLEVFKGLDLCAIEYLENGKTLFGYDATILPKVCEVWLRAKDENGLQPSQISKAQKASILMRGLAHVGVIALVDEATGYQKERAKDALSKILEAFIAKELQPWLRTFPTEYYEHLFRLRGLDFQKDSVKRPLYFGKITNDIIYARLAPGVLDELKRITPKNEDGRPKAKFFQSLTSNTGYPKLREHLGKIIMMMQLSTDYKDFKTKLERLLPKQTDQLSLPFPDDSDDGRGL